MRIVSWNINGLRGARESLATGIAALGTLPDVLCLQEIKCNKPTAIDILNELGYPYVEVSAAEKAGYSGTVVASLIKPTAIVSPTVHDDAPEALREGRIAAVVFGNITVVSLYTPNAKRDLSRLEYRCGTWERWFRTWVSDCMTHGPVIIGGDFNVVPDAIDIHNPDARGPPRAGYTPEERAAFRALLSETGLIDSFREIHPRMVRYSWWSPFAGARQKNKGWRIDLILADPRVRLDSADVHSDIKGSDHAPISLKIIQ